MDGGLPYDEDDAAAAQAAQDSGDHPMLDRALEDDYYAFPPSFPNTPMSATFLGMAPPTTSRDRGVIPEHVNNLLNRMSRSKVYLAEESSGIIHHDAEARIQGDPRLARLAKELDAQDPTPWLDAISETAPARIRPNALFVSSDLIKHLSTAKVFSWVSQAGATAMGIEWLNDSTLVLLFATPASTLLSLSMLAKAGFDPTEGDDPLLERAAHGIPASLLPQVELESESVPPSAATSDAGDAPMDSEEPPWEEAAPKRRGRGTFSARGGTLGSARGAFDLEPLAAPPPTHPEGVDPHARVTIRYATDLDQTQRRGARDSEWYARHGRAAGKEVSRRAYSSTPGGYGREVLDLKDRVGTAGEGREFGRRIGRERVNPYGRAPGTPRRTNTNDLDAELDRMAASRAAGDDEYSAPPMSARSDAGDGGRRRGGGTGGGGGGRQRRDRERANADALDRELDAMFAARAREER